MKHKIAIIGFGTVGQGLCEILEQKKSYLKKNYGFKYDIVAIADIAYGNVYNPAGLEIGKFLKKAQNKEKFDENVKEWDTLKLIKKCNADIVCELTYTNLKDGGPAVEHVKTALKLGKHVVTSNKGPAALYYPQMKKLSDASKVKFMIEGTVVAGTPVINLSQGPLAGCEIYKIRGILNGTTNYILSEMEKGLEYDSVLKKAQELGYAEADPAGDVEGYDARAKVTILANVLMGAKLDINNVSCKGITKITTEDIRIAKEANKRWKLIGCVEREGDKITGSVAPEMVDMGHPLAGVMGATNALTFTTDLLGDVTIVGPGAGRTETGFSILTDILAIHRQ